MGFTVADSGGSGTSLAFYHGTDDIRYIETKALHPKYLLKWGDEEIAELRNGLPEDLSAPLYFYGAGCSQPGVAYDVRIQLQKIGFTDVTVFSDALGACRACCGNESGLVAILGTGSVLLDYSGSEITGITGGLGSIVGDEGSGFFFGKLLVKYLFENKLRKPEAEKIREIIGDESVFRSQLAGDQAMQFISQLAGRLADLDLEKVHHNNLEAFFASHLDKKENYVLNFVGSYAWFQREKLQQLLMERNSTAGIILRNPISQLVKYHADLLTGEEI